MRQLLRALDVDVDGPDAREMLRALDGDGDGRFTLDEVRAAVRDRAVYRVEAGRYFVALALDEACALRAAIHLTRAHGGGGGAGGGAGGAPLVPGAPAAAIALAAGTTVLDASAGFARGRGGYQARMCEGCFRFADSDLELSLIHI